MSEKAKPSPQELLGIIGNELRYYCEIKEDWHGFPQTCTEYYLIKRANILGFPVKRVICGAAMTPEFHTGSKLYISVEKRASPEEEAIVMRNAEKYSRTNNISLVVQPRIRINPRQISVLSELDQMCPRA